jgi:hypothetical protein
MLTGGGREAEVAERTKGTAEPRPFPFDISVRCVVEALDADQGRCRKHPLTFGIASAVIDETAPASDRDSMRVTGKNHADAA